MDFITWAIQRADELLKRNGNLHSGEKSIVGVTSRFQSLSCQNGKQFRHAAHRYDSCGDSQYGQQPSGREVVACSSQQPYHLSWKYDDSKPN